MGWEHQSRDMVGGGFALAAVSSVVKPFLSIQVFMASTREYWLIALPGTLSKELAALRCRLNISVVAKNFTKF